MSWFTYVPPKAAAPTPEAPRASKYYHDYSKPAAPAAPVAAPAPEPAKQHPYLLVGPHFYPLAIPYNTAPNQPTYAPQPQFQYPTAPAAAPAAPAPTPTVHNAWYGKTRAEVDAENIAIAHRTGATKPVQLVPYDPSSEQQFWCRELDSSYTLRTVKDVTDNLQPGFWQYAQGGYPYWVRTEKK